MHEIDIVQGDMRLTGKRYGALNFLVTLFDTGEWCYKQFHNEEQARTFAFDNHLQLIMTKGEENEG